MDAIDKYIKWTNDPDDTRGIRKNYEAFRKYTSLEFPTLTTADILRWHFFYDNFKKIYSWYNIQEFLHIMQMDAKDNPAPQVEYKEITIELIGDTMYTIPVEMLDQFNKDAETDEHEEFDEKYSQYTVDCKVYAKFVNGKLE